MFTLIAILLIFWLSIGSSSIWYNWTFYSLFLEVQHKHQEAKQSVNDSNAGKNNQSKKQIAVNCSIGEGLCCSCVWRSSCIIKAERRLLERRALVDWAEQHCFINLRDQLHFVDDGDGWSWPVITTLTILCFNFYNDDDSGNYEGFST